MFEITYFYQQTEKETKYCMHIHIMGICSRYYFLPSKMQNRNRICHFFITLEKKIQKKYN